MQATMYHMKSTGWLLEKKTCITKTILGGGDLLVMLPSPYGNFLESTRKSSKVILEIRIIVKFTCGGLHFGDGLMVALKVWFLISLTNRCNHFILLWGIFWTKKQNVVDNVAPLKISVSEAGQLQGKKNLYLEAPGEGDSATMLEQGIGIQKLSTSCCRLLEHPVMAQAHAEFQHLLQPGHHWWAQPV